MVPILLFLLKGEGRTDYGAPVPGTLDAIRERMKNIQAAAAGKVPNSAQYSNGSLQAVVSSRSLDVASMESVSSGEMGQHPAPHEDKALSGLQARMERLKSGALGNLV
jgi:cytoskeleton-associated protein 5